MNIGIIVAMGKELELILPHLSSVEKLEKTPVTFYVGFAGENRVIMMECGIGKVNAAMGTTMMIDEFAPDLVVNTGVAAGAGDDVAVMDSVIAISVAHHDFWCIGEEWGHVPGCPRMFPTVTLDGIFKDKDVKRGLIVSGELFISDKNEVDAIRSHFPDTKAIDMESAAIAQVCYLHGVPFFCMRLISDSPWCSHDNSRQYEDFWNDAPKRSFDLVDHLLNSL